MSEVKLPAATAKDPIGRRYKQIPDFILQWLNLYTNRDGCRSPMQWENIEHAGFCSASTEPWLPVNQNFSLINVASEIENKGSLLHVYQDLLSIRRENRALHSGSLELLDSEHLVAYRRKYDQDTFLILINFNASENKFEDTGRWVEVVFQVGDYRRLTTGELVIGPFSGLVVSENSIQEN
jgi:glycosidase